MKRTWIKLKSGLLTPEHVTKMGPRLWLFAYMIDIADWPTGTINGWTDKDAGVALGLPEGTVRDQRRLLARDGYIQCERAFQASRIVIAKWVNPREYGGQVYNQPGLAVPDEIHTGERAPVSEIDTGDHTGDHTGDSPSVPSFSSHTTHHTSTVPEPIQIYRSELGKFPKKSWWLEIIDAVGDNLVLWRQICHAWAGSPYSPMNVEGVLDSFKKGRVDRPGGKQRQSSQPATREERAAEYAEAERQIAAAKAQPWPREDT